MMKDREGEEFVKRCLKLSIYSGFWILGLCNNFAYVLILSAAFDLLGEADNTTNNTKHITNDGTTLKDRPFHCNTVPTGAILLASVIPILIIKLSAPWFAWLLSYHIKIAICICLMLSGMLIVATFRPLPLILVGVVLANLSSGLGEVTFLSYTALFDANAVSMFSSGTGGSGIFGSLSYLFLTSFISPRNSIYVVSFIPILMGVAFWGLTFIPEKIFAKKYPHLSSEEERAPLQKNKEQFISDSNPFAEIKDQTITPPNKIPHTKKISVKTIISRILLMRHLLIIYMLPLFFVYLFEYMINQGLYELLYYPNDYLDQMEQYRWYQALYQLGVFLSRSSLNIIKIRYIWILSILQCVNFIFLLTEAYLTFIPFIFIPFCIIFYEGLLGGAVYANAFFRIRTEVEKIDPEAVEFSMGVASIADSFGITLAGFFSIWIHNGVCAYRS